jgi:hypothetical protein
MKRFALFSFGVLCLMLAVAVGYLLGSQTAQAQGGFEILTFSDNRHYVMLNNGDVYYREVYDPGTGYYSTHPAKYMGNYWSDQPVPTSPSTWGGVKSQLGGNN